MQHALFQQEKRNRIVAIIAMEKRVPKGSARMIRNNVNAAIRSGRRSHCYGNMKVAMRVMATKLGLIERASNPTEVFGSPHVDSTTP